MNIALLTTAGVLLILRWAHLIFVLLWVGLIGRRYLATGSSHPSLFWEKLLSFLVILTGTCFFYLIPSPLKSSWGIAIGIGFFITLIMFANLFITKSRTVTTSQINCIHLFPLSFYMSMASHLGVQVFPSASLYTMVIIPILPLLVFNILLVTFNWSFHRHPLKIAGSGIALTALSYLLLEVVSKGPDLSPLGF